MGFLELHTTEGSMLWLMAAAVLAVEDSPNETFTLIKTAGEMFAVTETAHEVLTQMAEIFGVAGAQ